jgi:hypothetical protein
LHDKGDKSREGASERLRAFLLHLNPYLELAVFLRAAWRLFDNYCASGGIAREAENEDGLYDWQVSGGVH